MNGYIYNATKNEREVLDSEKLRLIIKTEGNKTVIDGGKIMTNSITAKSISANSIYAEHISTDAIKTGHVSAGSIVSTHIKAEAILSTHIQSDTILARHIKADQINSNHIIANTILAKHIKANEIEAKHIKAGEVILPDEKYGGVYINSTGLNMINTGNHIALSAEKGLKIHNNLRGKTVFWANPTTGEIEMDVSKLTINSSNVYTKDNLIIGGRNLYTNTKDFKGNKWWGLSTWAESGEYLNNVVMKKYGVWGGLYQQVEAKKDEIYTFSAYVKTENYGTARIYAGGGNTTAEVDVAVLDKGVLPEWTRISITFKIRKSGILNCRIENGIEGGILYVSSLKLELGTIDTDWSPAPEDNMTKEEIESRFILENEKIELGVQSKLDNSKSGKENLAWNMSSFTGYNSVPTYNRKLKSYITLLKYPNHSPGLTYFTLKIDEPKIEKNKEYVMTGYMYRGENPITVNPFVKGNLNTFIYEGYKSFTIDNTGYFIYKINYKDALNISWLIHGQLIEEMKWINQEEIIFKELTIVEGNTPSIYFPPKELQYLGNKNIILKSNETIKNSDYMMKSYNLSEKLIIGEEYTLSIKGKINSPNKFASYIDYDMTSIGSTYYDEILNIYRLTFICPQSTKPNCQYNTLTVYNFPSNTKKEANIEYIKLEKGNTISDWSPAPEDIYSKEETDAKIKITKDEIDIGVNEKIDNIIIGGNNLLPDSESPKLVPYDTAIATYKENVSVPEWKATNAVENTIINKNNKILGTLRVKNGTLKDNTWYTHSIYVKNTGTQVIRISANAGELENINPGESKRVVMTRYHSTNISSMQFVIESLTTAGTSKFILWHAQIEEGNKVTDWSPSPQDSYTKIETDSRIKIETDKINLGVKEEIKYSGIGNQNMILNSSMDNISPYIIIDGIQRSNRHRQYHLYKGDGRTTIKNFNDTGVHIYDIGNDTTAITGVGFEKYKHIDLKEGDWVTFSADIENISSDYSRLIIFFLRNGKFEQHNSETLTIGQKKRIVFTREVPSGVSGILFRIDSGTTANAEVGIKNIMAIKGKIDREWSQNSEDLINDVYNSNLLENSDFLETNEIGQQAKNPDNYAQKWSMYNSGIGNATTNYHAYVSDSKFGYNVTVYDESDGTRHWKGMNQELNAEEIKVVNNGGKLWFSVDMYKEGNQLGNAKVWGGMYYYDKSNNRQFHDGYFYIFSSIVNEWERKSAYVPFDVSKVDLTKPIRFYIYGHEFTDNSKLYIKNVKLEIGKFVTPYELSSKDIVKVSEFKNVQLSLEPDAITQTVTSSQTFSEWSDEAIGGKANQVDLNITNEELEKTKKEIVTTVDKVGELKTQADGIEGSVTTITKRVEGQEEYTEKTKKFFTFDDDFLTIKKSDSLFNINITNEQMSFRNGKVETAFINGQKLFITEAQILKTIIVGNHQIQTDPATKQTIFKYIG